MAQEARRHLVRQAGEIEGLLPADVMTAPIESLGPPQALGRAALSGIHQLIRIIEQPLKTDDDATALKQQRLIGDMSLGAGRLYMRAAGADFRRRDNRLGELLRRIEEARRNPAIESEEP